VLAFCFSQKSIVEILEPNFLLQDQRFTLSFCVSVNRKAANSILAKGNQQFVAGAEGTEDICAARNTSGECRTTSINSNRLAPCRIG
jgi:hypothetical protein